MNFSNLWQLFAEAFAENVFYYTVFAAPFFLVFWVVWKKRWQPIRIQSVQRATAHHFKHDVAFSFSSFFIFTVMDVALLYLSSQGYTLLYFDVDSYGWLWLFVSFAVVLFIDDTFFYWSHRVMHHPKLYRFFHKVHHESTDPSPLTAFAFHPSEAFIENAMHIVLPFVLPLHFGVVLAWQLFSMLNNVLAHLGYELYPSGWTKLPFLKYKTASTHHNMHHQLFHGNYALYFTWWDKWMGTEFKEYEQRHQQLFERKHQKISPDGFHRLTVSAIRQEHNDAFTIQFDNVPQLFKSFDAGQHVTLKVNHNGDTLYRTFSLSSVPNVDDFATLTIKRIKGGKITNHLAQTLKAGDTLDVTAPSGQFFLRPEPANRKLYVMIAGGSGITPIYSMIGALLHFEPKSRIMLLYANRTENSILFREKLRTWAAQFPDRLHIKHFLSEEENPDLAVKGYITRVSLEEIVTQHNPHPLFFYLCGPELMTQKLIEDLKYLGVPSAHIHRELFVTTSQNTPEISAQALVTAKIFGQTYQFRTDGKQTILQNALAQDIPLPYSCQSGLCGMCKMQCTSGKAVLKNNQALTESELKAGYILTCQALPETGTISIQY